MLDRRSDCKTGVRSIKHVGRKDIHACFDGSLLRKELRMAIPMKYSSHDNALEATNI